VQPALGITGAMHRASSLRQIAAARASDQPVAATPPLPRASPRTAPAEAAASMPSQAALASSGDAALPLPPALAAPSPRPVLDLIAIRRSQRRYAATALPLPSLSALLRALHAGGQELLSAAVRIQLVAHAVADLAPGAYRYDAQTHSLRPRGPRADLRQRSRAAALDQDVIGDAAVAFVLSVDRATIAADALGAPRGYRHALLEAGLFGERIYLEATARGLGVCAVGAFYDDEAAALVGIDPAREWVVHFTAVGVSS
jgi:SagB-type dehydrogenase family enzyme